MKDDYEWHEVMDRCSVLTAVFEEYVAKLVKNDPKLRKAGEKALEAMVNVYELIGRRRFASTAKRRDRRSR